MRTGLLLVLGALHLLLFAAGSQGGTCSTSCNTNGTKIDNGGGNCVCVDHVQGDCCDMCAENTYRYPGLKNCVPCNCVTAASNCSEFDGTCICMQGVTGPTCRDCAHLYYHTRHDDSSTCTRCPCNINGTINCDLDLATDSYYCTCKKKAIGTHCDTCVPLHYPVNGDYGQCKSCGCNAMGTLRCSSSGKCVCNTGYNGTKCDQCADGYYTLGSQCKPCSDFCHVNGTRICTDDTCICKAKSNGMDCDRCDVGFYAPSNEQAYIKLCTVRGCKFEKSQWCQDCSCNPFGSSNMQCNSSTGYCSCKPGVLGPKCDSCPSGKIFNRSGLCEDPANFLPFGTNIASSSYGSDTKLNPSPGQHFQNIFLPLKIPIRGKSDADTHNYLKISSNGYVTVRGTALPNANIDLRNIDSQKNNPIIAPLWSNYDGSLGEVYYQLHTDSKTMMDTAQLLAKKAASFTPQYVLKVTWAAMRVNPSGQDAAQSDLKDFGTNNVQLLLAWDDCVSLSIFLYNTVSWTKDRNSNEIISHIWDGERLFQPASLNTSSEQPLMENLTPYPCSGYLLDQRTCKKETGMLSAIDTSQFISSYSGSACPATGFVNKKLDRVEYYLREYGFGLDCFLRLNRRGDSYAPVCCYDDSGSRIVGGNRGGWVTYFWNSITTIQTELNLRNLCCRANLCGLFYAKRPQASGGFSIIQGGLWGDPHLTTLDGAEYTFNGYGEYRLISADDPASNSRSVVQVRTTPLPNTTATVLTHAAVGLYNLSNSALLTSIFVSTVPGGFSIVVDNIRNVTAEVFKLNITGFNVFIANEFLTFARTAERDFSVSCINNLRVGFTYSNVTSIPSFAVSPAVPPTFSGQVINGLLGVYNGNSSDDFLSRNGTLLSVNSTEKELFHYFGQTWQITPEESLFVYDVGLGPNNYSHPQHIPVFTNELVIRDEVRQKCQGNTPCMFDAASTNNTMVGLSTMRTGEMLAAERVLLANVPPSITGDFRVNASIGKWVITSISVTDTDDFNVTFLGGSQMPRYYNFTQTTQGFSSSTYTLYWMPDASDRNLSLRFQATDSNKASSNHYVFAVFCPCANDQPCSVLDPGDDGGESRFVRQTCICNNSYNGDECSADRNGCTSGPGCYAGVNCTDNPAPATGATCGPCPSGLTGDGAMCSDILECSALPGLCASTALCTELYGSFRCNCVTGYRGNGTVCTDIDECTDGTHACNPWSTCVNKEGYYNCRCNPGYSKNGTACVDTNECALSTHNCDNYANCTNTIGSFTCKCLSGFTGDGYLCTDIDECQTGSPCGANGYCSNSFGSFTCQCLGGYTGSGRNCVDIDECSPTNMYPPCDAKGVCMNTVGRYQCFCRSGYSQAGDSCQDLDECATTITNNCSTNAACQNSIGAYSCACNSGYTGSGDVCTRIVCTPPSLPNGVFTPESTPIYPGVRAVFSCNTGYSLNTSSRAICRSSGVLSRIPGCIDKDECTAGTHNCSSNGVCRNTDGYFVCECPVGQTGDGRTGCTGIDECSEGTHNCNVLAACTDTPYAFRCTCYAGYTGNGVACNAVTCPRPTIPNGQVSGDITRPFNINETIMFSCNSGYHLNGTTISTCLLTGLIRDRLPSCEDINECENSTLNSCDGNATCVDRPGNYTCRCQAGYAGSGFLTHNGGQLVAGCQNVDECTLGTHTCQHATCMDAIGSFSCTCLDGFTGDGNCTDIDECNVHKINCTAGVLATCMNTVGSYHCACIEGYTGNGSVCTVVSCERPSPPTNGQISNGNFNFSNILTFSCNTGFRLVGNNTTTCLATGLASNSPPTCQVIDPCADGSHDCASNATCTTTSTSFSCKCNTGYVGNGQTCTAITCQRPSPPASGQLSGKGFDFSHVLTFSCSQGFRLVGSARTTCLATGLASNPPPTCQNINECLDNGLNNCDANAHCNDNQGSFSCSCREGYAGTGVVTRNESGIVPGCEKHSASSSGLSGGAVAGIAIATFAVGCVTCFLLIPWYKQHRARKSRDRQRLRDVLVGERDASSMTNSSAGGMRRNNYVGDRDSMTDNSAYGLQPNNLVIDRDSMTDNSAYGMADTAARSQDMEYDYIYEKISEI